MSPRSIHLSLYTWPCLLASQAANRDAGPPLLACAYVGAYERRVDIIILLSCPLYPSLRCFKFSSPKLLLKTYALATWYKEPASEPPHLLALSVSKLLATLGGTTKINMAWEARCLALATVAVSLGVAFAATATVATNDEDGEILSNSSTRLLESAKGKRQSWPARLVWTKVTWLCKKIICDGTPSWSAPHPQKDQPRIASPSHQLHTHTRAMRDTENIAFTLIWTWTGPATFVSTS